MGSAVSLNMKCGIEINGIDLMDLDPLKVSRWISRQPKDQREFIRALIKSKMMDDSKFPIFDDYAKHAGRPPLSKVPYMRSENDGYPYLPGHAPNCDGTVYAKQGPAKGMCKCKYDKWNHEGNSCKEIWPGMDIDDFDM
jgi:hypothetical protein